MKNIFLYILLLFVVLSCGSEQPESVVKSNASVVYEVSGMTCEINCARYIKQELSKMKGVEKATVNFEKKLATIYFDDKIITDDDFENKIESLNDNQYTVKKQTVNKSSINNSGSVDDNNNVITPTFELPNIVDFFTNIL